MVQGGADICGVGVLSRVLEDWLSWHWPTVVLSPAGLALRLAVLLRQESAVG